jgi:5-methylcytosine-specific restriction endonuclease McrA
MLFLDWRERRLVIYCRDEGHCRYCGQGVSDSDFQAHHIRGKSVTGDHRLDNLVTLCTSCHSVMPGHTADLKKRGPSSTGRRKFVATVKQTEMGGWTKDLVNKIVSSLAAKYSLPAPTRKKSRT